MCPIGHLSDVTFLKKENGKFYYTITGTKLNQVEKTRNSTGKIRNYKKISGTNMSHWPCDRYFVHLKIKNSYEVYEILFTLKVQET
jgi:hypothetical protein